MPPAKDGGGAGLEIYTKGGKAWINCEYEGFRKVTIEEVHNDTVIVRTANGELVEVRKPLYLVGDEKAADDLRNLNPLHDPAVLENSRQRFAQDVFYTYTGVALIAVNPMKPVKIYGTHYMQLYHHANSLEDFAQMPPHIYATGETAFRRMVDDCQAQSIIVSGESGAGKTVTSRYLLQYFAMVTGKGRQMSDIERHVEQRIIQSNPILEAFGNATTLRNENSSRFGKYLRLQFGKDWAIAGAAIETYLLEKSRVVTHARGERAYHIFYQLYHGHTPEEAEAFRLSGPFQYMVDAPDTDSPTFSLRRTHSGHTVKSTPPPERKGSLLHRSASVSSVGSYRPKGLIRHATKEEDKAEMAITRDALAAIGIDHDVQWCLFQTLAAILHLGQITVAADRAGNAVIEKAPDSSLALVASLLEVEPEALWKALVTKKISTRTEVFFRPTTLEQGVALRDSLAKAIYDALFLWLVDRINQGTAATDAVSFIGILDIYGFERFAHNSLEQLCINYANEKLQQQFVAQVFRLEQEVYVREGIAWSFVAYTDNRPCLDLLEGPGGVLVLLDEQCTLQRAVDAEAYTNRLYATLKAHSAFQGEKAGPSTLQFTVKHYAMDVTYNTTEFISKNLDRMAPEHLSLMLTSRSTFVQGIFDYYEQLETSQSGRRGPKAPNTVVAKFRGSLASLTELLDSTSPHYIRCIKPNSDQSGYLSSAAAVRDTQDASVPVPAKHEGRVRKTGPLIRFDGKAALDQLHAAGVLDVVKISQAGYPIKIPYEDFTYKYHGLVPARVRYADHREATQGACEAVCGMGCPDIQYGRTMVFLRMHQAFVLDHALHIKLKQAASIIQGGYRGMVVRRMIARWRAAAITIQARVRGHQGRQRFLAMKGAAIKLQAYWRMIHWQTWYHRKRKCITRLQATVRAWSQLRCYRQQYRQVVTLQTWLRGRQARQRYLAMLANRDRAARLLQTVVRNWLASLKAKREKEAEIAKLQDTIRMLQQGINLPSLTNLKESPLPSDKKSLAPSSAAEQAPIRADSDAGLDSDMDAVLSAINAALSLADPLPQSVPVSGPTSPLPPPTPVLPHTAPAKPRQVDRQQNVVVVGPILSVSAQGQGGMHIEVTEASGLVDLHIHLPSIPPALLGRMRVHLTADPLPDLSVPPSMPAVKPYIPPATAGGHSSNLGQPPTTPPTQRGNFAGMTALQLGSALADLAQHPSTPSAPQPNGVLGRSQTESPDVSRPSSPIMMTPIRPPASMGPHILSRGLADVTAEATPRTEGVVRGQLYGTPHVVGSGLGPSLSSPGPGLLGALGLGFGRWGATPQRPPQPPSDSSHPA